MTKETPMEETKECKCVWVDDFLKDCTDCPIHTIRGSSKLPNKEELVEVEETYKNDELVSLKANGIEILPWL